MHGSLYLFYFFNIVILLKWCGSRRKRKIFPLKEQNDDIYSNIHENFIYCQEKDFIKKKMTNKCLLLRLWIQSKNMKYCIRIGWTVNEKSHHINCFIALMVFITVCLNASRIIH